MTRRVKWAYFAVHAHTTLARGAQFPERMRGLRPWEKTAADHGGEWGKKGRGHPCTEALGLKRAVDGIVVVMC